MSEYYWYNLLSAWHDLGNTGLSIPFLVGAQGVLGDDLKPSTDDIDVLLDEIFSFDIEDPIIRIKWCNNTQCFVIGLCDRDDVIEGAFFKNTFVSGDLLRMFGTKLEGIRVGLREMYSMQIEEKLFSRNRSAWTAFTDFDKRFILDSNKCS